ncbi:MAG: hypothetical protein NZ750_10785 [Anaerolineae bacterium]|nr:hypothetical protein [Anaerolineae bacterium]MDW8171548.1 hypothetical protein [Anaerolineae bacterium]
MRHPKTSILLLIALLLAVLGAQAQESTEEPTPTPAAEVLPTETPVGVLPTETPTEALPSPTLPAESTAEATQAPTQTEQASPISPAPITISPISPVLSTPPAPFSDNFADGVADGWMLSEGWRVEALGEDGDFALVTELADQEARFSSALWGDLLLRLRAFLQPDDSLTVALNGYVVTLHGEGYASLSSSEGALIAQGAQPAAEEGIEARWHDFSLRLVEGNIAALLNGALQFSYDSPLALSGHSLALRSGADNAGLLAIDDVDSQPILPLPPLPPAPPTPEVIVLEPTIAPEVEVITLEPTIEAEVTPEAEFTPEAQVVTLEPTIEAEVTPEAEATAEAEATPEAETTAEAEATPEAPTLAQIVEARSETLDKALGQAALLVESGDLSAARALLLAEGFRMDAEGRPYVVVYAALPYTLNDLKAIIEDANGTPVLAESVSAWGAFLPLETLATLISDERVHGLARPSQASSTGPQNAPLAQTGTVNAETLNIIGATHWHGQNIRGNGVRIGVIDVGFNGISTTGEFACVGSATVTGGLGTGNHGLSVIQVLCDVAPQARVFAYSASTPAQLNSALIAARNANMNIVVIPMDLGVHTGAGDGQTGLPLGSGDVYDTLASLRSDGILVVASAGNNRGRQLSYTSGAGTSTFTATTVSGSTINVSWNGWSDSSAITVSISGCGAAQSRSTRVDPTQAGYQFSVPAGTCTINISNANGKTVQVQVTGEGSSLTAGTIDGALLTGAGQIARPADSPDVLTVGAACGKWNDLESIVANANSSAGPIFALGGGGVATPGNVREFKPNVLAPGQVSVSGNLITERPSCESGDPASGFRGSSAAAAHLAGMAALLRSHGLNSSMSVFSDPDRLFHYLLTHTFDLNLTTPFNETFAFDALSGAGLAVLGNPAYDIGQAVNLEAPVEYKDRYTGSGMFTCTPSTTRYVGLADPRLDADGTISKPYTSVKQAVASANPGDCIILMPGEYTTPITITKAVRLISYAEAGVAQVNPSRIWVNNGSDVTIGSDLINLGTDLNLDSGRPGVVIKSMNNPAQFWALNGFVFGRANVNSQLGVGDYGQDTRPIAAVNAYNGQIGYNNFNNFFFPVWIDGFEENTTDNSSVPVHVTGNTFTDFRVSGGGSVPPTHLEGVALHAVRIDNVQIASNRFVNSLATPYQTDDDRAQQAVVAIAYSGATLNGNIFTGNSAEAAVSIDQWEANWPNDPNVGLDEQYGFKQWINPAGGNGTDTTKVNYSRADEVRLINNVFADNTLNAVVHVRYGTRVRFVNNTVANNAINSNSSGDYGAVIALGGDVPSIRNYEFTNPDHRFELHNNLVYGTAIPNGLLRVYTDYVVPNCPNFSGTDNQGAHGNWFVGTFNNSPNDNCRASIYNSTTDTMVNDNMSRAIIAENRLFFTTANDAAHPYRLLPPSYFNPDSESDLGIDGGVDVSTVVGSTDARGAARNVDLSSPITGIGPRVYDIGAYELALPDNLTASTPNATITANEDTMVITFNIKTTLGLSGGVEPYRVTNIVPPSNFNTSPSSPCGPLGFTYDPATYIMSYCPPPDFYTVGAPTGSTAVMSFDVESTQFTSVTFGLPVAATVTFDINPTNDGSPVVYGTLANPLRVVTDVVNGVNATLLPQVRFNNFTLGAPSPLSGFSRDYPFTYSYVADSCEFRAIGQTTFTSGCTSTPYTEAQITAALAATGGASNAPFAISDAPTTTGTMRFSYTLIDRDGQTSTNVMELIVLPRVANVGIYDDFDLGMIYGSESPAGHLWTPAFLPTAHNFTNTTTRQPGDYVDFTFKGDGFVIAINANTATPNYEVLLDTNAVDGNDALASFNTITGLTCNRAPIGSGAFPNAVLGSTSPRIAFFACQGLDATSSSDNPRRLRLIHRGTTAQTLALDFIRVRGTSLPPGFYEEDELAGYSATGWFSEASAVSWLNRWVRRSTGGSSATLRFTANEDVRQILIQYPTASTFAQPRICVKPVGGSSTCRTASVTSVAAVWTNTFSIDVPQPGAPHEVTISFPSSTTTLPGYLESLELLGEPQYLGVGSYADNDPRLRASGLWTTLRSTIYSGGQIAQTIRPGSQLSFGVDGNVRQVFIRYTDGPTHANFDVFVNGTRVRTVEPNTTPRAPIFNGYLLPIDLSGNTNKTIAIRANGAQTIQIDDIELLPAITPLAVGDVLRLDGTDSLSRLQRMGVWSVVTNAAYRDGNALQTTRSGSELRMTMASSVPTNSRLVIYYTAPITVINFQVRKNGSAAPAADLTTLPDQTRAGSQKQLVVRVKNGDQVVLRALDSTAVIIEQIELLPPGTTPLGPGYYEEDYRDFSYANGTWVRAANPTSGRNGFIQQAVDTTAPFDQPTVTFQISASVREVIVHHPSFSTYAPLRVVVGAQPPVDCDMTRNVWSSVCRVNVTGVGTKTVTITGLIQAGRVTAALEAIQLLGDDAVIPPNEVVEESDPRLTYSGDPRTYNNVGLWSVVTDTTALGVNKTARMANRRGQMLQFVVADAVDRVAIFMVAGRGFDNYRLCRAPLSSPASTTCTDVPISSAVRIPSVPMVVDLVGATGDQLITLETLGTGQAQVERVVTYSSSALDLGSGYYEEDDPRLLFNPPLFVTTGSVTRPWTVTGVTGAGRNARQVSTPSNNLVTSGPEVDAQYISFRIDSTIRQVLIQYPIAATNRQLRVCFGAPSFTNCQNAPVNTPTIAAAASAVFAANVPTPWAQEVRIRAIFDDRTPLPPLRTTTIVEGIQLLSNPAPQAIGTVFEMSGTENADALQYGGTWTTVTNTLVAGGQARSAVNRPGSQLRFAVASAGRVRLVYTSGATFGNFDVLVNGATVENVPNVGAVTYGVERFYTVNANDVVTIVARGMQNVQIERIDILGPAGALGPGYYEENDPAFAYDLLRALPNDPEGWQRLANTTSLGNRFVFQATASANTVANPDADAERLMSFTINDQVRQVLIYYPGLANARQLRVEISGNACIPTPSTCPTTPTTPITSTYSNVLAVPVEGPYTGTRTVTLRWLRPQLPALPLSRSLSVLEAIHLLGDLTTFIPVGQYLPTDDRIERYGAWTVLRNATLQSGEAVSVVSRPGSSLRFGAASAVNGLLLSYTASSAAFGNFEVRVNGNVVATVGTLPPYGAGRQLAIDLSSFSGNKTITIHALGTQTVQIEQIDLLGGPHVGLTRGLYPNTDPAISYDQGWTLISDVRASGGNLHRFVRPATGVIGEMTFTATGTGVTVYVHRVPRVSATAPALGGIAQLCYGPVTTPNNPADDTCTTLNTDLAFGNPYETNVPLTQNFSSAGTYFVRVRCDNCSSPIPNTLQVNVDHVEVLDGTTPPMTRGVYPNDYIGISYGAGWARIADARASEGNLHRLTRPITGTPGEMRFVVQGRSVRVFVHRIPAVSAGTLQICYGPPNTPTNTSDDTCGSSVSTATIAPLTYEVNAPIGIDFGSIGTHLVRVLCTNCDTVTPARQINVDHVEVLDTALPTVLTRGIHPNTSSGISYGAGWNPVVDTRASDGNLHRLTRPISGTPGEMTFTAQGTGVRVFIHRIPAASAGTLRACYDINGTPSNLADDSCFDVSTAVVAPNTYETNVPVTINFQTPGSYLVRVLCTNCDTVTPARQINVDHVEVLDGVPAQSFSATRFLMPGLYSQDHPFLDYSPAWSKSLVLASASGGRVARTTTSSAALSFGMEGTGVIFFVQRQPSGGTMEVCWTSDPDTPLQGEDNQCTTFSTRSAGFELPFGLQLVGLPKDRYTLSVRCTDCTTTPQRSLTIDHLLVVDTTTLNALGTGDYDDRNADLAYAPTIGLPVASWTRANAPGFSNNTLTTTRIVGAPLMFRVNGSIVRIILKAQISTANAQQVRVCVARANNPTQRTVECALYSQLGSGAAGLPIELRNLGRGDKVIFIDNIVFGRTLTIDQVELR